MARRRAASIGFAATREIPHEAASEGVARAGGIVRFFERECRDAEDAALVHHHGAIFTTLDDEGFGTELEDVACRE
jgi:hypothetical protein